MNQTENDSPEERESITSFVVCITRNEFYYIKLAWYQTN